MIARCFVACRPVLLTNPYFLYNLRLTLKHTISTTKRSSLPPTFGPRRALHNFNRGLTTTSNATGSDNSDNFKIDPNDPIIAKISQNPKLIASIQEFSQILKSKGLDLTTGKRPSMLQMARLATDGQVKQKLIDLNKELKNAGIEFNAETAQKYMMFAPQETEKSSKTLDSESVPPIITTQKTKTQFSSSITPQPSSSSSSPPIPMPPPSSPILIPPPPSSTQPKESSKSTSSTPSLTAKQKSTNKPKQENATPTKIKKESARKIANKMTEKSKEQPKETTLNGFLSKIKSFFKFKK